MSAPRTVTVPTRDHGDVTIPEPDWCTGEYHQPGGARIDITHTGPDEELLVPAPGGEAVLIRAALEQRPFTQKSPGRQVFMAVEIEGEHLSFAPADLLVLAAAIVAAGPKVEQLAARLAALREGDQ